MNWMRLKLQAQALGEGAHGQRLGQARHAFEQHVAAGQQADQQPSIMVRWPTMTLPISR